MRLSWLNLMGHQTKRHTVGERFVGVGEDLVRSGKEGAGCDQNLLHAYMKKVNESINLKKNWG